MKKCFAGIGVTIFLLVVAASIGTAEPIVTAEPIPLVTGEWAPYVSEKIKDYGFISEVVIASFKEIGIEPKISFYPWKRCAIMVEKGEVFASFPFFITETRKKYAHFSDPIGYSRVIFFFRKDRIGNLTISDLADLEKYRIGGALGYFYEPILKKAGLQVIYRPSAELSLQMLYHDRVDIMPEDELVGWDLIKKLYPQKLHIFGTTQYELRKDSLFCMVSKKFPNSLASIKQFNKGVARIKEKGIYKSVIRKYID